MADIEFGASYYQDVIKDFGYDPSMFDGFTEDLPRISRDDMQKVFLCHQGLYDFRDSTSDKAVLTGFGLSGVPHMGTLSQMNRVSILNQAGYFSEVILGDLDAYNGKLIPIETVKHHAVVYKGFLDRSGILNPDNSRVRNQYDDPEVLRTAYLIGRFVTDGQLEAAEEDLHEFYAREGRVDSTMTYRRKLSLNLMVADFFNLGQTHPEVLVMLGIDEHQYVRVGQQLADTIDPVVSGLSPVRISSLYTPIIKGLNGYPKMSKSFPDSGITLTTPIAQVEQLIMREPDTFKDPDESVVYQIACGIGLGHDVSLSEVWEAANERDREWCNVKKLLISRIALFGKHWEGAKDDAEKH